MDRLERAIAKALLKMRTSLNEPYVETKVPTAFVQDHTVWDLQSAGYTFHKNTVQTENCLHQSETLHHQAA